MEKRIVSGIKQYEKCPDCGADVSLKSEFADGDRRLVLYETDGSRHECTVAEKPFEKHPIGQAVINKRVTDFQLKGRVLTIYLEGGNVLSVSAAGKPLSMQMSGPRGFVQE